MSFDFSTLVTDRTQADVSRVKQIAEKIKNGTVSESELAEFNSAAMKGAYNYTDLNRVTAAMEALKSKLEGYGYAVPGYQRIEVPHPVTGGGSRLPEGYMELSWIESTGTQYIDTGFKPNQDTKVVVDGMWTSNTNANRTLFGTRTSSTSKSYYLMFVGSTSGTRSAYNASYRYEWTVDPTTRRTIVKDKNTTTIDGTSHSWTYAEFQCDYNMVLFALNEMDTIKWYSYARIYSCQIYDNGTLVRDYIPCINPSGEVGLYDLVTAAFFGNSGTGSFVAGAIPRDLPEGYTQVEYIQSSGSQYIDTLVAHSASSNIVLTADVSYDTVSPSNQIMGFNGSGGNGIGISKATWWEAGDLGSATVGQKYYIKYAVNGATWKRTVDGVSVSGSRGQYSFTTNLFLLAANASATNTTMSYYYSCKLYSAKVFVDGSAVRDFVPCKNSGGVVGLYDMANDVFYQNAGTGTFAAGEEVPAPSTASVMVVSGDVTEYDPYTWYEFDWPTTETMTVYLLNVSAIRAVLAVMKSTPAVPVDMEQLLLQEANNIEIILLDVLRQLTIMPTTFIPCGEALCGGDNL